MSPPHQLRQRTSNCSSLLIYRPRKDERLSWPSWLTYSGWFTHVSGHPSATGRAQDSESTPAKDQCSTSGPRNQPCTLGAIWCVDLTGLKEPCIRWGSRPHMQWGNFSGELVSPGHAWTSPVVDILKATQRGAELVWHVCQIYNCA